MNLFPDWKTLAASGYLFRIVDSGEDSTVDRVTVLFSDGDALGCDRCGGRAFSQWVGPVDPATLETWVENGEAVDLSSDDLSEDEKAHILRRVNEGWRDWLEQVAGRDPGAVASAREDAEPNDGLCNSAGKGLYTDAAGAFWVHLEDNPPEDDRGPFTCPAEALRATLPDEYSLAGPEYQSPAFPEAA
jgi:hypothetical protein